MNPGIMNENKKFVVPVKSTRVAQKGKRSTKENKYPESPKTPQRIATFTLYGVKSPYRSSKPSDKPPGKRFSFISSQVSTPGKSPGQLIKNFRHKVSNETNDENARSTETINSKTQTIGFASSSKNNDIPLESSCTKRSRKVQQLKDIYELDTSPDINPRNRKKKNEELTKQKVLQLIAKMSSEFHEFKKRHKQLTKKHSGKAGKYMKNMQQSVPNAHKEAHSSTLKQKNCQTKQRQKSSDHKSVRTRQHGKVIISSIVADENSPPFEPMEE